MNKASLPLIIGLIALTGCASHYVLKLDNNSEFTTATKPILKDDVYYFKDAKGEEHSVPKFRVRELRPPRRLRGRTDLTRCRWTSIRSTTGTSYG